MEDGKVEISTELDTKNITKGTKEVTNKLKGLKKEISATSTKTQSLANISSIFTAGTVAIGVAIKAVQKFASAIKDLNAAYLTQAKAEKQLEVAAKNNPLLNKENVNALKDFAGQMQKISTIGDEQMLPMMAELAAAGRSQAEIQDIIATALDVSASGAISFESAVEGLNRSFSGTAGTLTKLSPSLKNLTQEELAQGGAVKLLGEQYKGMAKEVASTTGAGEQLKNAWGDLKETLGAPFNDAIKPVQNFFAKLIQGWADALAEKRKYKKEKTREAEVDELINGGNTELSVLEENKNFKTNNANERKQRLEQAQSDLEEVRNAAANIKTNKDKKAFINLYGYAPEEAIEMYEYMLEQSKQSYEKANKEMLEAQSKYNEAKATADAEALKQEQEDAKKADDKKVTDAKTKYDETIKLKEQEIADRKKLGEEITDLEEKEALASTKNSAALTFLKETAGLIKETNPTWNEVKNDVTDTTKAYADLLVKQAESEKINKTIDKWSASSKSDLDTLKEEIQTLKTYQEGLDETATDWDKVTAAIEKAEEALEKMEFDQFLDNIKLITDTIISGMSNLQSQISTACSNAITAQEDEAENAQDELKLQYDNGIIDYEEYLDKKHELEKEAAQKEYKIKMAEWSMNLAMATAQAAQAVVNALAEGTPPVNILNATTAGLLGAAQVAAVMGSKPVAPSFATGGFLTGNSYYGDKIAFMGNAGEAILNPAEQRNFMALANGTATGGASINMPININNNASDVVGVSATRGEREMIITINKVVEKGLTSGTYNNGLSAANSSSKGVRVL